jgi:hypothetical protein
MPAYVKSVLRGMRPADMQNEQNKDLNCDSDTEESLSEAKDTSSARFYYVPELKGKVKKTGDPAEACRISLKVCETSYIEFQLTHSLNLFV